MVGFSHLVQPSAIVYRLSSIVGFPAGLSWHKRGVSTPALDFRPPRIADISIPNNAYPATEFPLMITISLGYEDLLDRGSTLAHLPREGYLF
jgi:hypothetical protein